MARCSGGIFCYDSLTLFVFKLCQVKNDYDTSLLRIFRRFRVLIDVVGNPKLYYRKQDFSSNCLHVKKKKKGQQDFFLTYIFILCELFAPEFIIIHSIQLIHLQNISKDVYQVKNGAQIKGRIKT